MSGPSETGPDEKGPEPAGRGSLAPLLAVCGVLLVIVVLVGVKWTGARRGEAECRGHLELLWKAASRCADGNGGNFPSGPRATEALLFGFLHNDKYLVCPATREPYSWTARLRRRGDPAHLLLAWEKKPHGWPSVRHRVLFVNGRVEDLNTETLAALLSAERSEPAPLPEAPRAPRPGLREPPEAPPPGTRPAAPGR